MTYKTDIFGLTRPVPKSVSNEDADQWASILEDKFIPDFEGMVAFHGPFSDRPSSPPVDVLYHATDCSEWYCYDAAVGEWHNASAYLGEARHTDIQIPGAKAAYQQVGPDSFSTEYRNTQQVVGTRQMACHWPLVDPHFRDDSFAYQNNGTEQRTQLINYSFLDQPPNAVPVVRAQFVGDNLGSSEAVIELNHKASGTIIRFRIGAGDNNVALYDERYLHEHQNGSAARGPNTLTRTQIDVVVNVGGQSSGVEISGSSQVMLDWEVV